MKALIGVTGFVVVLCGLLLVAPICLLWGLNTISEQSSMAWYIPHNVWTYLSVYGMCVPFTIVLV